MPDSSSERAATCKESSDAAPCVYQNKEHQGDQNLFSCTAADAALATGLLQALGTPWVLFRYYWILVKFGLAILASIALLIHQFAVMAVAAKRASGDAAETLFSPDLGALKTELVRAPSLAIVLLLVVTTLGVYKPWGLTRYGLRKQQERGKLQRQQPDSKTPLGVKIFFAVVGVLVLVFVLLHLTGHGFENHGH